MEATLTGLEVTKMNLPLYILMPIIMVVGIVAVVGIRWIYRRTGGEENPVEEFAKHVDEHTRNFANTENKS